MRKKTEEVELRWRGRNREAGQTKGLKYKSSEPCFDYSPTLAVKNHGANLATNVSSESPSKDLKVKKVRA